jgi:hypothetical protein
MGMSTEVSLPKSTVPLWPDRCVRCGRSQPGETHQLAVLVDICFGLFPWRSGITVPVPACGPCWRRLARNRVFRYVLFFAPMVLTPVLLYVLVHTNVLTGRLWSNGQMPAVGLVVGALPGLIYNVFFPMRLDASLGKTFIKYEFADARAAEEFKALNSTESDGG